MADFISLNVTPPDKSAPVTMPEDEEIKTLAKINLTGESPLETEESKNSHGSGDTVSSPGVGGQVRHFLNRNTPSFFDDEDTASSHVDRSLRWKYFVSRGSIKSLPGRGGIKSLPGRGGMKTPPAGEVTPPDNKDKKKKTPISPIIWSGSPVKRSHHLSRRTVDLREKIPKQYAPSKTKVILRAAQVKKIAKGGKHRAEEGKDFPTTSKSSTGADDAPKKYKPITWP